MFFKDHPIILFIDRNGFSVFQDTQSNIPRFNFTPDIVANLDVVNKEQFSNLIATFIQINKIVPSSLAVVLSDTVIYTKDLIKASQDVAPSLNTIDSEHKEEIQNFLEDVPFEEVLAKVIKIDQLNRIVAVNKDLVMVIIDTLVSKGSAIEAITPGFMYGQNANFALGLTSDNALVILENAETLKSGNLLTDQEKMIPSPGAASNAAGGEKKPQNLRQYIFIAVFVTLLVIFAVVFLNLGASKTPPQSSKIVPTTAPRF